MLEAMFWSMKMRTERARPRPMLPSTIPAVTPFRGGTVNIASGLSSVNVATERVIDRYCNRNRN